MTFQEVRAQCDLRYQEPQDNSQCVYIYVPGPKEEENTSLLEVYEVILNRFKLKRQMFIIIRKGRTNTIKINGSQRYIILQ